MKYRQQNYIIAFVFLWHVKSNFMSTVEMRNKHCCEADVGEIDAVTEI